MADCGVKQVGWRRMVMMMMLVAYVRGYIPSKSCFEDPSQVNCSNADKT